MSAVDEVIALLTARIEHHRIGRSTWREMDQDILAMRKAIELLQAPAGEEREAQGWREAGLYAVDSVSQDDFMAGWRTADRLQAPATDEERFDFAEFLDDLHGPYIEEGGCSFQPIRRSWRPGVAATVDAAIVEPILRKFGRAPLGRGEITDVELCTWCPKIATGLAAHNDGHTYPSCGEPDHGLSWVSW